MLLTCVATKQIDPILKCYHAEILHGNWYLDLLGQTRVSWALPPRSSYSPSSAELMCLGCYAPSSLRQTQYIWTNSVEYMCFRPLQFPSVVVVVFLLSFFFWHKLMHSVRPSHLINSVQRMCLDCRTPTTPSYTCTLAVILKLLGRAHASWPPHLDNSVQTPTIWPIRLSSFI